MRITRLHLLLAFMGLVCAGYGTFVWMQNGTRLPSALLSRLKLAGAQSAVKSIPRPVIKPKSITAAAPIVAGLKHKAVARQVANVGAAYMLLVKRQGEVPSVAHPLKAAKSYLAENQDDQALASAQEAWAALKNVAKNGAQGSDTYEVVRGDTLWRIARDHSPVHQGPGWVAIWRANKNTIKNFDRLEVGWNLKIPVKRSRYAMHYWKPRPVAVAKRIAAPASAKRAAEPTTTSPTTLSQLLFFGETARPGMTAAFNVPSQTLLAQTQYH